MPFLGKTPAQGFVNSVTKDDFTPNGTTTAFTLSKSPATVNEIEVYVGNVRQEPTDAYSVSGTTLTMTEAPATNTNFYVMHIGGTTQSSTVVGDGTVTSAKIVSGAVNTTQLATDAVSTAKIASSAVTSTKLASTLDLSGTGRTGHGGFKSVQVFTSNGTYTKPAGIRTVKVTVTGAGAGGGGYGAANDMGGGGGAGGTAIETIDISGVSTVTVNVGAGGAGGSGGNDGTGGGGSSFGSYATGNGGSGGRHGNRGSTYGGGGGTATGGDINITGGSGNNGIDNMYNGGGTDYRPSYGMGGASFWGGGGRPGVYNVPAQTGRAFGSGGGGGSAANTGGGEAGKAGIVYVEEFA